MAAIVEFTKFDRDAVTESYNVNRLFNMSQTPGTIFIQLSGSNPGFAIGDEVTYVKDNLSFSGKIWYIYRSPDGSHFNLYVKHPDWEKYQGVTGGTVYPGIVDAGKKSTTSENQVFESAATKLHDIQNEESIETPSGTSISTEDQLSDQPIDEIEAANTTRTLLIVLGIVAGILILTNVLKTKKSE